MESTSTRKGLQGQGNVPEAGSAERGSEAVSGGPGASEDASGERSERAGGGRKAPADSIHLIHEHKVYTNPTWDAPSEAFSKRLERYTKAKRAAGNLLAFLRSGLAGDQGKERAGRLADCASWMLFRKLTRDGSNHLYAAPFCQQPLLCQACAIRRASRSLQAYIPKLLEAQDSQPGRSFLFVTLTVKNGDLKPQLHELCDAVRRLVDRCRLSRSTGRRRNTQMQHVAGGVGSVEIKRGKGSKLWHPHYHGVWVLDQPVNWKALKAEWSDVLGYPSVSWLSKLKSQTRSIVNPIDQRQALMLDLQEVFKYPMKFSELRPADQWFAFEQLAGSRLLRSFGCLRGIQPSESYLDAPINWADEGFFEIFYRWMGGRYQATAHPQAEPAFETWNASA